MANITLPNMTPRPYQLPVFRAMDNGIKRAWLCWHRRAGKDEVCMHITAKRAAVDPGNYWHCLPEYAQARKALWEAVNPRTGKRRIDEVFPPEIRRKTRDDEMFIELFNGSTWRLVGSDRFDGLVGAGPRGIVFSEYALSDPTAWDYMRPMLLESGGWAIFNSTVRGRNHFWKLGEFAKDDPAWFYSNLTADMTGVFTTEQLDGERREMLATHDAEEGEARFRQEYYNDPDVAIPGAYYAGVLQRLEADGRIGNVPYDPRFPVTVAFDLGFGDSTAMWFAQSVAHEVRIIDYYESSGVTIEHYVEQLRSRPYSYDCLILPHDSESGSLHGDTVAKTLRSHGFHSQKVLPPFPLDDSRINLVRNFLPRCWFDNGKCGPRGLNALRSYHREWDSKLHDWKARPKHDWSSHAADAFLHLAAGFREAQRQSHYLGMVKRQAVADAEYNILG